MMIALEKKREEERKRGRKGWRKRSSGEEREREGRREGNGFVENSVDTRDLRERKEATATRYLRNGNPNNPTLPI